MSSHSVTNSTEKSRRLVDKAGVKVTRTPLSIGQLLSYPTDEELQACWELCRLFDNMSFWVIWLPTGSCTDLVLHLILPVAFRLIHDIPSAWSIMMTYHHEPQIMLLKCIMRASVYVPLCFGIQSLVSIDNTGFDAICFDYSSYHRS